MHTVIAFLLTELLFNFLVKTLLRIELDSANPNCNFTWSLPREYSENTKIYVLTIETKIDCALTGSEEFQVFFPRKDLIRDKGGNPIEENMVSAKAMRMAYASNFEKKLIASSGTAFTASSFVTLIIAISMILFQ